VTIVGNNFTNVSAVYLGVEVTIHGYDVVNSTTIEVNVTVNPNAAAGSRPVQVTTNAGMSDSQNLLEIINNRAPIVRITSAPDKGAPNTVYTFDGVQSTDPDGAIVNYQWEFGDGKKGIGPIVSHRYGKAGSFNATLMVTDNDDASAIGTVSVKVRDGVAPTAKFSVFPQKGDVNTLYTFDASVSDDPDGSIKKYLWDFGNGQTATGVTATMQFKSGGTYFVILTVTDDNGLQNALQKSVDVGAFDQNAAADEIRSVVAEFFRRFALLPSEPAEWIVVNWSSSDGCYGRAREISIIEREQTFIIKNATKLTAPIDVTFQSTSKAHAIATAQFDWTESDGSVHTGSATHDFTMIFIDGKWQVCNFFAF
jgi:PKD repeat protein